MVGMFIEEMHAVLRELNESFEIICVNDGSTDNTMGKLLQTKKRYSNIRIINLSRNFGKEAALTAGLDYANGEVIIPIDADLQDPPELITELIQRWQNGYDVVLAKRVDRSSDSVVKKLLLNFFINSTIKYHTLTFQKMWNLIDS